MEENWVKCPSSCLCMGVVNLRRYYIDLASCKLRKLDRNLSGIFGSLSLFSVCFTGRSCFTERSCQYLICTMSRRSLNPPAVPSASKSFGINNRKCVVVGQKMLKTEVKTPTVEIESPSKREPRLSDSFLQDRKSLEISPTNSVRSSNSSFYSSVYGGGEGSIASRETRLLDELTTDVKSSACQLKKLAHQVEELPVLRERVGDMEREKKTLAEDLSEKCEIIETMKQRLSVLHEQNIQLAQLTNSPTESSDTTLRMRNALVASLAQIKKLQSMVDEIPGLKSQILSLNQEVASLKAVEQDVLKHLPEGVTSASYHSLQEDNLKLKAQNETLSSKLAQLSKNVENSMEDMKRHAESFEKSLSTSASLTTRIKQLEKEKDDLYDEITRFKVDKSLSLDIDAIFLSNECDTLRKANSMLQDKLEQLTLQYNEFKEKMILKSFEIDVSGLESQKSEIDRHLSGVHVEYGSEDVAASSPDFKPQFLKLQQCRLEVEQSHRIMHMVLSEKEDLERKLAEVNSKLEERSVVELETKVRDYESKLSLAKAKVKDLEKRLRISSQTGSADRSALLSENISLKAQLSLLQHDNSLSMVTELKKQLLEEQRSREASLQKYKKSKEHRQKLEVKLKDSVQKYQTLATELSDSVQLVKNYQQQCAKFQSDIEVVNAERETFRKEVSSLKAELEVIKAELSQPSGELASPLVTESNSTDNFQNDQKIQELFEENRDLKLKLRSEGEEAQRIVESKTDQLEKMEEKFSSLDVHFKEAQEMLQQSRRTSEQCNIKIDLLQAELKSSSEERASTISSLESKIKDLSEERTLLSNKLTEALTKYQSEVSTKDQEINHLQSLIKESEIQLSHLVTEVNKHKSSTSTLTADLAAKDKEISRLVNALKLKESEVEQLNRTIQSLNESVSRRDTSQYDHLNSEIEGYKAIIKSLQRQLDEAETREIEHELLRQKIRKLEQSLGNSSHDNKALIALLHETVQEMPSFSETEKSLREHNLQLEEQISVLSQWNDKQRLEVEELETRLDESVKAYSTLLAELTDKEDVLEENSQLKRELKEVEMEVNVLRRQVRADLQEELQLKLEAQTQLLSVFSQHNTLLQQQIDELQAHVKMLGGTLARERAVSPPPMPDIAGSLSLPEHHAFAQSLPALEKENLLLKQRIQLMEEEVLMLHGLSVSIRRCGSALFALMSISIKPVNEDVFIAVPNEILLPCSLLADHLQINGSIDDPTARWWIDTVQLEWFACVSQKSLTPTCAQSYIAEISRLSHKLLDVVINLQDEKGNTALHFAAANGNLPALNQFINLRSCDPTITNKGGFTALMLLAASRHEVDFTLHREVVDILVERSGINVAAERTRQTSLMLAACSANSGLLSFFLEKGCDVNLRDKDGSTALMFAVQRCHENIVWILLSAPLCDVLIKDNDGRTAKDIAKDHNYHSILSILKRPKS